jgi:hypothetical protein
MLTTVRQFVITVSGLQPTRSGPIRDVVVESSRMIACPGSTISTAARARASFSTSKRRDQ